MNDSGGKQKKAILTKERTYLKAPGEMQGSMDGLKLGSWERKHA